MSRRTLLAIVPTLFALLTAACSSSSEVTAPSTNGGGGGGPATQSPVGTYELRTIDGHPLPAHLGDPVVDPVLGPIVAEIHLGRIVLDPYGAYQYDMQGVILAPGMDYQATLDLGHVGSYQATANSLTMTMAGSPSGATHEYDGHTITITAPSPGLDGEEVEATLVFAKVSAEWD